MLSPKASYKAKIHHALAKLGMNGTQSPDHSNLGGVLSEIYLWETVRDYAADKCKTAWLSLEREKLIKPDDFLRDNIDKEEVVVHSDHFSIVAKVSTPRSTFDRDLFIEKVGKKFKIDKHKLIDLAQQCTKQSKAPLSKRIIEIG